MYLEGSETVRQASIRMAEAASDMRQAASSIDFTLQRNQDFLNDWLARFEAAIDRLPRAPEASNPVVTG